MKGIKLNTQSIWPLVWLLAWPSLSQLEPELRLLPQRLRNFVWKERPVWQNRRNKGRSERRCLDL